MSKTRWAIYLSAALAAVILIAMILPMPAVMAGSKTDSTFGVTLYFPDDQFACEKVGDIYSTNVPDGWSVTYHFFDDALQLISSQTVSGNQAVSFPYPANYSGAGYFAVTAEYIDASGQTKFKIGAKWYLDCSAKPTDTPTPTPTDTPTPTPTFTPPPPSGGQGCTPGYWRQEHHYDSWMGYSPSDDFETVFSVDASFSPTNLGNAVQLNGGGERALARHAVAALLNSTNPSVSFFYTTAQVISMVQQAYATGSFETVKNLFEAQNDTVCPLN